MGGKGISNLEIKRVIEVISNDDDDDLVGVFVSNEINYFIIFPSLIMNKDVKYPFLILNTDRADRPGTH